MNIPRKGRVSLRVPALLLAFALAACGGAEDAGLAGGNTDPEGSGASSSGGADAGGKGGRGGDSTGGAHSGGTSTAGGGPGGQSGHGGSVQGGTGGAGATSGNGGSGGTGAVSENCTNGVDDDGDTAVDCADDDCSSYVCVSVPDGWLGPVAVHDGPDNVPAGCGGVYSAAAFKGGAGLVTPDATCGACRCEVTESQCRARARLTCFVPTAPYADDSPFDCARVEYESVVTVRDVQFEAFYENCGASGDQPELSASEWSQQTRACGPGATGSGCTAAANVCVPVAPAGARLCTYQEGVVPQCPQGYEDRLVRYTSVDDERCAACCGNATKPDTCTLRSVSSSPDPTCFNSAPVVDACVSIESDPYVTVELQAPATDICTITAEQQQDPVEEVVPGGPVTICCMP